MEETSQKIVVVTNRHVGTVGYVIPEHGIHRVFARGESKKISVEELEWLSWVDGGDYILKNYLMVQDKDALSYLNMEDEEPEYFYTEADVKKLLLEGTLDQLEDALNFAPDGVLELIKNTAVDLEIPDTRKRDMISKKLDFNINNAININHMMDAETAAPETQSSSKQRKAAPITSSETPAPARKASSGFKSMT